MRRTTTTLGAGLALLLLAACGSTGGGLGDIFGGGSPNTMSSEVRGTVDDIDLRSRSLILRNVTDYRSRLANTGGDTLRVYFDDRTPVEYQGQNYRVEDLERGDEVAVRLDQQGNTLMATSMTVLRDASPGGSTYPSGGVYSSNVRGTVRYVDPNRRTIEIDRGGYGATTVLDYDSNTYVSYGGRQYRPDALERGDEVDIRVRDLGSGRMLAQDINVIRSVSSGGGLYGGGTTTTTADATLRGTVRYVDINRRTIELDQTNWISGFNTGRDDGRSIMVTYGTNTGVEVGGQVHPVSGLERGDIVDVHVDTRSNTPYAHRIILIRDISR